MRQQKAKLALKNKLVDLGKKKDYMGF